MFLINLLNLESFSLIMAVVIDIILIAIILLKKNKSLSTIFFLLFTIFVLLWVSFVFLFNIIDSNLLLIVTRSLYAFPVFIPPLLLFFTITFPNKPLKLSWKEITLIALPTLFVAIGSFIPNFVITHVTSEVINGSRNIFFGKIGYVIYFAYIVIYFCVVLYKILKKLLKSRGLERDQIEIIFISICVSCVVGVTCNLILPTLGIYRFMWIGPFFSIYMVSTIAYAIAQYQLFDIKVIAIEFVTLALWIFILIRIFLATNTREVWIEIILLLITVAFGVLLIRSVLHEIEQRKKIENLASSLRTAYDNLENLNKNLEQKVREQTKEIRASYEVEKKARLELEKLGETKDQFIMISQHHLRTPITGIRWQIQAMLSGAYGNLNPEMKQALNDTNISVERLTHIINEFLDITSLKTGMNILNMSPTNIKPICDDIIQELKPDIVKNKIFVTYSHDNIWPELNIDEKKIREALFIILENAVTYNKPGGTITISSHEKNNKFELIVENNGIDIAPEDQTKIFKEMFYRGKQARTTHPTGMGIGLFVAKSIIEAHGGSIEISPRNSGGGRVIIKLTQK